MDEFAGRRITQEELDAMVEAHTRRHPMNLSGLDASGLWVVGKDLGNAVFDGANLERCHICSCMLERASFQGASLRGADLSCSHAPDLDLSDADLTGADLHSVDLTGVDLVGANLSWADLRMAKLSYAALLDTNLAGADVADAVIDADNLGLFGDAVGLDRAIVIDPTARPQEGPVHIGSITHVNMLTALKNGVAVISERPDACGLTCQIGDGWFYFADAATDEITASEYVDAAGLEAISRDVADALDGIRESDPDEFAYYVAVLDEAGILPPPNTNAQIVLNPQRREGIGSVLSEATQMAGALAGMGTGQRVPDAAR